MSFYFRPVEVAPGDYSSDRGDDGAENVWKRELKFEKRVAVRSGATMRGEAARTLGYAQCFALLVFRSEDGNQSKERRSVDSGPGGENPERDQQAGNGRDIRNENKAERDDDQGHREELALAESFDERPDPTALQERGEQPAIGDVVTDFLWAVVEFFLQEQPNRHLEGGEGKGREEVERNEKTDGRTAKDVGPLFEADAARPGFGGRLEALHQHECVNKKLAAQIAEAIQPGPSRPNLSALKEPSAGPKIKPRPNAMPIRPMLLERFSGGLTSAM